MWVDQLDFFCSGIQVYLLLSPYLCFISFLYLDLYVLGDDALISWGSFMQTKHLCVLIHIWTKGEVGAPLNRFKPSSKIFYWPFQGGNLLWIFYAFSVFCLLCLCTHLFICALWSPAGKGVTSWLSFVVSYCESVTFLLVSWVRCGSWLYRFLIFAPLTYFEIPPNTKRTNDMVESFHMYFNAHFYTTHPTIFAFLSRGQHTVVLYVLILLYDERKWPLPGKFAYINDLYICSFNLFAARCIHRHGMMICLIWSLGAPLVYRAQLKLNVLFVE